MKEQRLLLNFPLTQKLMKSFKIILLSLFVSINFCQAQDTTIILSTNKLDKVTDQIKLGELNGWIFKQEPNPDRAKINIDTTGWKRLRPNQLSAKYADKNGRVEGWFRIKVKLDSSLLHKPIYFDFASWSATEFYIDDRLVATRGNTAKDAKAFREYNGDLDPLSMRLDTSVTHILSLHFVGYLSPLPPHNLKTQSLNAIVTIGGPNYIKNLLKSNIIENSFYTLWIVVGAILSILFWLFLFQNPKEKNLFWVALYTSALTIYIWSFSSYSIGITYIEHITYSNIGRWFILFSQLLLLPIILIKVFERKIKSNLIISLAILFVINISLGYLPNSFSLIRVIIFPTSIIFVLGICLYYIITSWKSLKGAQWAIVIGLVFSIIPFITIFLLTSFFKELFKSLFVSSLFFSVFSLSLPLSLLFYVSMRFKEMLQEVQANAQTVVELSEEKREQAVNQQKVLEAEVTRQTSEIRQTLENLKSTQSQLIQSEKMASLGELTAGIAHEIQNPLNFVNNFSEVSTEMIDEMKEEISKGDLDEAIAISEDLKQNLEKISLHGNRASNIVKGMLEHSRNSSGTKELTDINALADEYLKLTYHGLRAKDKSFNSGFETHFDSNLPKIKVIPQDMGRVLLNLINNAFYAVKTVEKPLVEIKTELIENQVIIKVSDNGTGIPEEEKAKIFQPFFTTKPTGQGTGLGLSLAYDMITKGHGGTLKVESTQGVGTEFIITLPLEFLERH